MHRQRRLNTTGDRRAAGNSAEHGRSEARLRAAVNQARILTASVSAAREEEGRRIARELHDQLGGALSSLRWDIEATRGALVGPIDAQCIGLLRRRLGSMLSVVDGTISAVRRIASELRPSVLDLGLTEAVEWQAEQFHQRTGITCVCDVDLEGVALTDAQSTAVFRILQEALTNVLRHAAASDVRVSARIEGGSFVLRVVDHGRGITEEEQAGSRSLGILGMCERAAIVGAELKVVGTTGTGTEVSVRVPLERFAAEAAD